MLAGVEPVDDRGTVETILDSYREAGFDGTVEDKWRNVETMTGGSPAGTASRTPSTTSAEATGKARSWKIRWLFSSASFRRWACCFWRRWRWR